MTPSMSPSSSPTNRPTSTTSGIPPINDTPSPTNTNTNDGPQDETTTVASGDPSSAPAAASDGFFDNDLLVGILIAAVFFLGIIVAILGICLWYVRRIKSRAIRVISVDAVDNDINANTNKAGMHTNTTEMATVGSPSNPSTLMLNMVPNSSAQQPDNVNEGQDPKYSLGEDLEDSSSSSRGNAMYTANTKSTTPGNIMLTPSFLPKNKQQIPDRSPINENRDSDDDLYREPKETLGGLDTPLQMTPEMNAKDQQELDVPHIVDDGFYARVIADYNASDEDQLDIKQNQIVFIMKELESGWWYAIDDSNNDGWIPSNYVEKLNQELEQQHQARKRGSTYDYGDNFATNLDKYLNYSLPPQIVPMVVANMVTNDNDDSDDNYSNSDNANHHKMTATAE